MILVTILHTRVLAINDPKNLVFISFSGIILLIFLILYMGLRPLHAIFGDTVNYVVSYTNYQYGLPMVDSGDLGWEFFMNTSSKMMSIHGFFTLVCVIYIFPMYKISKKYFKEYWYYAFLMFVVSFSFWTYGVNGIRNGAASSLFLWGLCYRDKKWLMAFFFLLAISFHKTLYLPILAFILTYFYNNPKTYFKGWLACIPLSLILGGFWISFFAGLGFGDERFSDYLLAASDNELFTSTGFRWDFLFHSAFAVFAGWYFIYKKNFKDEFYYQLLNTYLICNSFWILIITANYSNRFAYLSWFMMALVIIYPLLKKNFFKKQHAIIGNVIIAYFAFTYMMYYIYYN